MITKDQLIKTLIKGRLECYIKKNPSYNPYAQAILYDWEFKLEIDDLVFTDAYRGFNPYSGVEYVYKKNHDIPIWFCDYIGYVNQDINISSGEVYNFLKEGRKKHLDDSKDDLFSNYTYEKDILKYKTSFTGDLSSLLQIEDIYYKEQLVAKQISAGRLKEKE